MIPVVAMAILLATYALGEMCAQKTKAVLSTTLVMAVVLLAAFWTGLPSTIFKDAGVSQIGNIIAVMLIVSLGTTIDFAELKRSGRWWSPASCAWRRRWPSSSWWAAPYGP